MHWRNRVVSAVAWGKKVFFFFFFLVVVVVVRGIPFAFSAHMGDECGAFSNELGRAERVGVDAERTGAKERESGAAGGTTRVKGRPAEVDGGAGGGDTPFHGDATRVVPSTREALPL